MAPPMLSGRSSNLGVVTGGQLNTSSARHGAIYFTRIWARPEKKGPAAPLPGFEATSAFHATGRRRASEYQRTLGDIPT